MTHDEFNQTFPNEEAAQKWFESKRWPNGRRCPRCNGTDTYEIEG